jgi:hypothetical protein
MKQKNTPFTLWNIHPCPHSWWAEPNQVAERLCGPEFVVRRDQSAATKSVLPFMYAICDALFPARMLRLALRTIWTSIGFVIEHHYSRADPPAVGEAALLLTHFKRSTFFWW